MLKKLLASFLIAITLFLTFAKFVPINAAVSDLWIHEWYGETNPFSWYAKVYDPSNPGEIFGERYTAAQVQWITYGVFSMLLNLVPGNPELTICLTSGSADSCLGTVMSRVNTFLEGMGINVARAPTDQGLASVVLGRLNNSPVSGIAYVTDLVNKFSPVSSVKAQEDGGFGFTAAGAVKTLWAGVRNFSYGLLVLATIIMAFMIMFRVKLSPQVVITIQSAIPKLVIAMILITFSYAIAGFLIDIMYVVIGLISLLFNSTGLSSNSPGELFTLFAEDYSIIGVMYLYWIWFVIMAFVSISMSGWGGIFGIFVFLIAIFSILAILWWSIKIFIECVKNLVMILLTIVIGPLQIGLGTVMPGMGFGQWLKSLVSYLAFYPVLIIMSFFSFFFLWQGMGTETASLQASAAPFGINKNVITGSAWDPPLTVGTQGGANDSNTVIWVIVSFVIFSQITKVAKMVQSFMAGKPFEMESGIGEAFGIAKAPVIYSANTMAEKGEYPRVIQSLATKLNKGNPPDQRTTKVIGETLRSFLKK